MLPTRTLRHAQQLFSISLPHTRCLVLDSRMYVPMLRGSLARPVQRSKRRCTC